MEKKVLVINYHEIVAEPAAASAEAVFSVSAQAFEAQVQCLLRHKISIVSLDDILNDTAPAGFSVAITIDDGNASDLAIIYPALKAAGMPATFFWLGGRALPAGAGACAQMAGNGFSIGSHGMAHVDLTALSSNAQQHELAFSKQYIAQQTGHPADHFAFPFGMYSRSTVAMARQAGYKAACTTDVKLNNPAERPFLIHRWSVRHNTSITEFEGMVTNGAVLQRKIAGSRIKKAARRLIGLRAADRLNMVFNT